MCLFALKLSPIVFVRKTYLKENVYIFLLVYGGENVCVAVEASGVSG